MIRQRIMSLGMILGLGFLLLVSLIISSLTTGASQQLKQLLGLDGVLAEVLNYVAQSIMIFLMIAAILRYKPDAKVHWRDVIIGSEITTLLFLMGRTLNQVYFAYSPPGKGLDSAAASLMAFLVWVYYTSLILLFGAETTQVLAKRSGREIQPKEHAVRVTENVEPA